MENNNDDEEVVRLRNKTISKYIGQDKGDYITISEMIKTIKLFNLENVIENDEIVKIFDDLDYRGRGKVKKSILVTNLQNSNTEQGYKLYQALTKNFNSKSEKIIHKLKFIKNHQKLKDEPELLQDISWIITTLADEDIYLPEFSLDQNNGNKEMFGLMTNIEISQNKMNDLRVVNGSIDPYKTKSFMNLKNKRKTMLPFRQIDNQGIKFEEHFETNDLINRCDFNLDNMSSNSKKASLFCQPTDLSHIMKLTNIKNTIQKQNTVDVEIFGNKKSFTMDDMYPEKSKDSKVSTFSNNENNNIINSSNLKNPNKKKSEKNLVILENKNNTETVNNKPIVLSPKNQENKYNLNNVTKNGVKITSIKNENESPQHEKKTKFKKIEKIDDDKNEQKSNINKSVDIVNSLKINNLTCLSSEAYEMLNLIDTPEFDIFDLDKILNNKTLYYITHTVFKEKKYFDKLINIETFNNFTQAITTEGYTRDIPYHNDLHAADVFQTVFVFFSQGEFEEVRI
jgi:hypothetical protein